MQELKKALTYIQNIQDNKGIDIEAIEDLFSGIFTQPKIIDLENTKAIFVDCIKFTLLNNISENLLGNQNALIPQSLVLLVQRILSLSRETKDGQMIENLLIILFVLSPYLEESTAVSFANSIFTSCTAKKGD